jgi:hypothetical protein
MSKTPASSSCSVCGAPGANKTTCPLNPAATAPKPEKHFKYSRLAEIEADKVRLMMPSVPKTYEPISRELTDQCELCHKLIRWNPIKPDDKIKRWLNITSVCENCANLIGAQHKKDTSNNTQGRYKKYHTHGNPTLDQITAHGGKDSYYNGTMYDGARYWSAVSVQRAMPSVPKSIPK